ncbi:MAG TPA: acetate/propionate family kinase, partial [Nitrosospira sp.]
RGTGKRYRCHFPQQPNSSRDNPGPNVMPDTLRKDSQVILTVNTGSSSVRLAAFAREDDAVSELASERYTLGARALSAKDMLGAFMQTYGIENVDVSAHRVVHGGETLNTSRLLDRKVEAEIDRLAQLAPLHNPVSLHWIRAAREVLGGDIRQVAVFDTAFFAGLPPAAKIYPIPHALSQKYRVRRYGFHGLAHQAMWQKWQSLQSEAAGGGKVVSVQLGSGCSITAIDNGLPRDTSMGFSPLEGLMMATRSGDVDPGLATFLQRQEGLTAAQLDRMLNEHSGLLGVSGASADMRELLESQDDLSRLAVEIYCYRVRKYIGAYLAVLGGANAITFGGGVGENLPAVRERILGGMEWCGIEIDLEKNRRSTGPSCISTANAEIEVWVIPVDEAELLAREAVAVMGAMESRLSEDSK